MTDLIGPFSFSVYDKALKRSELGVSGIWLDNFSYRTRFGMWVDDPQGVPNLQPQSLLVHFDPSHYLVREFPCNSDESKIATAAKVGPMLCAFVQGVVLGWNTISRSMKGHNDVYDEISISKFIAESELDRFTDDLGISDKSLRTMCRNDVLRYAITTYESHGREAHWTSGAFRDSAVQRVPYSTILVASVLGDLESEGLLRHASAHDAYYEDMFQLAPKQYNGEIPTRVKKDLSSWARRVQLIGIDRGFLEASRMTRNVGEGAEIKGPPKVFIIHGHDEAKRRELKELLEDHFALEVVVMQDLPGKSRTLIEKFEEEAGECNAAIAVMTPDDVIESVEGGQKQPRLNVIYELGWFGGRYGRDRTLMVVKSGTDIPSDLQGIERIEFNDRISERLLELGRELDEWAAE